MAYIITKSEERLAHEAMVRRSYRVSDSDTEGKECCEIIAARTREAIEQMDREGSRKSWS